jgi:hypothetical protein
MLKILLGHRSPSLAKSTLGVALAMGVLTAGQAKAFVVTVNSLQYDVTTFFGTYNANTSQFATAANGGVMPWWGSSSLASQFATQVGSNLGTGNEGAGPLFGYQISTNNSSQVTTNVLVPSSVIITVDVSKAQSYYWAKASLVAQPAAPVPGPLPALGAAAAFGFSRQLRKRIKRSTNAVSSSYRL